MKTYSPTPAERSWCIETLVQIKDFLPAQYSEPAQLKLRQQGIEVSRAYIRNCKNLFQHDARVVKVLEQLARDSSKGFKKPTKEDIKKKYF